MTIGLAQRQVRRCSSPHFPSWPSSSNQQVNLRNAIINISLSAFLTAATNAGRRGAFSSRIGLTGELFHEFRRTRNLTLASTQHAALYTPHSLCSLLSSSNPYLPPLHTQNRLQNKPTEAPCSSAWKPLRIKRVCSLHNIIR